MNAGYEGEGAFIYKKRRAEKQLLLIYLLKGIVKETGNSSSSVSASSIIKVYVTSFIFSISPISEVEKGKHHLAHKKHHKVAFRYLHKNPRNLYCNFLKIQ